MTTAIFGSGLALLVLALPQPVGTSLPLFPAHDFDLSALSAHPGPVTNRDIMDLPSIDPAKEGIKGGQWDELPPTRWTYQAGEYGPAIELGTGGGKLKPLRDNRPKQRDGKLAHLVVGWDF
jgi:hypothetical protein